MKVLTTLLGIIVISPVFAQNTTTEMKSRYNRQKGTVETYIETKKVTEPDKPTNTNSSGSGNPANTTPTHFKPAYSDIPISEKERAVQQKALSDETSAKWAKEKDKEERVQLARLYPNRINQLKADIEKAGITIEPKNYFKLRQLVGKEFTYYERNEMFPASEFEWQTGMRYKEADFPLSQSSKAMHSKAALAAANATKDGTNLRIFRKNKKEGICTETDDVILMPTYDLIESFLHLSPPAYHGGFTIMKLQEKWGVINKLGEEKISPQYEAIRKINIYNRIVARKNGKWGVIDTLNNVIVPFQFEEVNGYDERYGLMSVKRKGKWGVIDIEGKELCPFIYQDMETSFYGNGKVDAKRGGRCFAVDTKDGTESKKACPQR